MGEQEKDSRNLLKSTVCPILIRVVRNTHTDYDSVIEYVRLVYITPEKVYFDVYVLRFKKVPVWKTLRRGNCDLCLPRSRNEQRSS